MKRLLLLAPLGLAACTAIPTPKARPKVAAPRPAPVAPAPARPERSADWRDRPYTPGTWHYADRIASYGPAGAPPLLTLRCDPAHHIVMLAVRGTANTLTVRTSYAARSWPAGAMGDGTSAIRFVAADPALDQIAFSRGRFSVTAPGLPELDIPAWAEPSRVIEDCRG